MGLRLLKGFLLFCLSFFLFGCQTATEAPSVQDSGVLKLEELSYTDIDALDREKTIFVLTFGNMEEHGPHLPVGSDYFQVLGVREGLVKKLRQSHPGYTFVLVPVVPLGEGGFNDMARQFDHVGTFGVRFSTLRDVAVDLGAAIAGKGFRNIFLLHNHGMPMHNVAFTQASAFVSEKYSVRMTNISSLMFGPELYSAKVLAKHLGDTWETELGMAGHAGPAETSANLYLRGELVKPEYKTLPAFPVMGLEELGGIHLRDGFQGYMNDPSKASRTLGRDLIENFVERSVVIAEKALAGEDLSGHPRWPDVLPSIPELDATMAMLARRYQQQTADLDAWLQKQQAAKP